MRRGSQLSRGETEQLFQLFLALNKESTNKDRSLRACVAEWIGACCSRFPDLLSASVSTLQTFLSDSAPEVIQAGIRVISQLFRPSLVRMCESDIHSVSEMKDLSKLWRGLTESCTTIKGFVTHENCGVRNSTVKFLELAGLLLSLADDSEHLDAGDDDSWTLEQIPPCHPILDYTKLKNEGEVCKADHPFSCVIDEQAVVEGGGKGNPVRPTFAFACNHKERNYYLWHNFWVHDSGDSIRRLDPHHARSRVNFGVVGSQLWGCAGRGRTAPHFCYRC